MAEETVVRAERVSKKYCRRLQQAMWYGLRDLAGGLVGSGGAEGLRDGEFWALRDVGFELKRGECLGVIGANGSGKSTLLKLLSGILQPDAGRIEVRGRTAALIEVGAGFHPLLTGRENIYVNGAILGMRRREVDAKFDAIVDFAGIGEFLDTPVKFYSSGMYARLGFSVAAHVEPDLLLVDEVLAVGDAVFQKKCLGQMEGAAKEGRAVVFVSHNLPSILKLCERVLWLDNGHIAATGQPGPIVDRYLSRRTPQEPIANLDALARPEPLGRRVRLSGARLISAGASAPWAIPFGTDLAFEVNVEVCEDAPVLELGIALSTTTGFEIASALSAPGLAARPYTKGRYVFRACYRAFRLTPGRYRIGLGLISSRGVEDYLPEALEFEVLISPAFSQGNLPMVQGAVLADVAFQVGMGA